MRGSGRSNRAGVWKIKTGTFIPDDERWLHQPDVRDTLDEAVAWAEAHPRRETDLDELEEKLDGNGESTHEVERRPRAFP